MNPSPDQLVKWARISEDGAEVTIPSSAWVEVIWMLRVFERLEGNESVESAFAEAANSQNPSTPASRGVKGGDAT